MRRAWVWAAIVGLGATMPATAAPVRWLENTAQDAALLVRDPQSVGGPRAGWVGLALAAALALDDAAHRRLRGAPNALSRAGNAYALAGPALGVAAGWGLRAWRDDARAGAIGDAIAEAAVLSGVAVTALKIAIGRRRPLGARDPFRARPGAMRDRWMAFPSGHTALAFTVAGVLDAGRAPAGLRAGAWALAGLTAWARLRGERHWLSDVVAGAWIGYRIGRFAARDRAPAQDAWQVWPVRGGMALVWRRRW